jgi:hypothetical protein
MHLQIFVSNPHERIDMTDWLYWFEENGMRTPASDGTTGDYRLEILVDGIVVFDGHHPEATWGTPPPQGVQP